MFMQEWRRALLNMSREQERQINKVLLLHESREAGDKVVRSCQCEAFMNDYKALVSTNQCGQRAHFSSWTQCSMRMVVSVLMEDCNLQNTCHMVYDFLRYCCEVTGLQSSLLSITMNKPTIQQVLSFCFNMCKQRRNKSSTNHDSICFPRSTWGSLSIPLT